MRTPDQVLVQAARSYYEDGRTQDEIAQALRVSRSQVSHYLRAARERGIVQIRVLDPSDRAAGVEAQLAERFPHLREIRVVPLFSRDSEVARRVVGRAAASFLQDIVRPGHRICIGCGRTLREMVRALKPTPRENVSLVQAMGSLGHEAMDIDFAELARDAAKAFGARAYLIPAPAILGAGTSRALIDGNQSIAKAMDLARTSNVYVVGLGSLESDLIYARSGLIRASDYEHLVGIHAIGDICGRFFDLLGRPLRTRFEDRVVGIELADLRRAALAVGVAGGLEKAQPLLGALRGRYINAVITDDQTASEILRLDETTSRPPPAEEGSPESSKAERR